MARSDPDTGKPARRPITLFRPIRQGGAVNHVAGGTLPADDRPVSVHTLHAKRGWACEILAAALKLSPAGIVEHDIDAGMAAHRFKTVAAASRAAGGRP